MIRTKWFSLDIKAEAAELSIFDEIGGFGIPVSVFKEQFDSVKGAKEIRLYLNSPGGSVTEGMAIYNILSAVRDKLSVEVIGLAASMASVVALAGHSLVMDEGTYLMIHNPWTISWGDADQLRKDATVLDKMRTEIISIYKAHSNKNAVEIGQMMADETWLTAQEALDAGFATEIQQTVKAVALYDVSAIGFKHAPSAVVLPKNALRNIKTIREYEAFLRDAGIPRKEASALASGGWKNVHRDGAHSETSDQSGPIIAALCELAEILR